MEIKPSWIAPESRIGAIEELLESDRTSLEQVVQSSQVMTALESRMAKVENVLSRFIAVLK